MASSPPGGFHTSLPTNKKRPSISSQSSSTVTKKPRLSQPTHPLRQTSFPAIDSVGFYAHAGPASARSETGSITASVFSNTTATSKPAPRGRGRPRKSTTINSNADESFANNTHGADGTSQARGGAKSVISNAQNQAQGDNADDDEEQDDLAHYTASSTDAAAFDEAQTQRRDRLKSVLDPDALLRFEKWRGATLNKASVRRLVNQIVSQSVTENPVQAVRVGAKWFVAEIVETARVVQEEWAEAYETTIEQVKDTKRVKLDALQQKSQDNEKKSENEKMSEYDSRRLQHAIQLAKKDLEEYIPNPHRGGLLPDHLREALRRYRANGEGGGVGFEGMSHPLLGVQGNKTYGIGVTGGAGRLFK